jgi:hypothetical protein
MHSPKVPSARQVWVPDAPVPQGQTWSWPLVHRLDVPQADAQERTATTRKEVRTRFV